MHQFKIGGVEAAVLSADKKSPKDMFFKIAVIDKSVPQEKLKNEPIVNKFHKWNPVGYLYMAKKIYDDKPDVLVCSLWRSFVVGILVQLFFKQIKVICFFHNTKFNHILDKIFSFIGFKICTSVFVDSLATKNFVAKYTNKRIFQISFLLRKLDKNVIKKSKLPELTFLFFGRVTSQKRIDKAINFINQLKIISNRNPLFYIIGPDEGELDKLRKLIEDLHLEENIKFLGSMTYEQITDIAQKATFYLQLSDYEGMAMSVIEAMQMGLIPIVTPVGEIKNYVKHLENGIVFNNYSSSTSLVLDIIHDNEKYQNILKNTSVTFDKWETYPDSFFSTIKLIDRGAL
jgi:glycosyltransferase involved in cell wall biosynthesis